MARDVTVTPEGWVPRGEAFLKRGHRRLLIWSGIPGEAGVVRIFRQGQNQDMARFIRPAGRPHPLRQDPPCPKYNRCGGCPLMHLTVGGQHRARLAGLRQALGREGLERHAPTAVVPSPGNTNYRHVAKMAVGLTDFGHLRLGALGRDSRTVVPISGCLVVTDALRQAMGSVAHHAIRLSIRPFDARTDEGVLRYVVLRHSRATSELLVTLVAGRKSRELGELAQALISSNTDIVGVHLHLNNKPGNAIFDRGEEGQVGTLPLQGKMFIEEMLGDVRLRIGPGDFFQVNPAVAETLVADVLEAFAGERDRPAVDLFSGVGGFALALGRAHGWAIGVEGLPGAVTRARENARLNQIPTEFVAGDVVDLLPEVAERLDGRAPVVVVDPARRGLGPEIVDSLLALEPARLAYVSCNSLSLAKDLARFVAAGWNVDAMTAYDMFPQTAHLETLTLLSPPIPVPPPTRRAPRRRIVR